MSTDILNISLAFLEGFALIISPCILPILPLILVGSLEGGLRRPLGVISGFVTAFTVVTLFSRWIVHYTGIDLALVRYLSYGLLLLFGFVLLSTYLTEKFSYWTRHLANTTTKVNVKENFSSGFIFGNLVGIVWTPCAGPILAAVILQTVLQQTQLGSFFVVLAFGIGAAFPMLLIAFLGRRIIEQFKFFSAHAVTFRKIVGMIIIASVIWMFYGEGVTISMTQSFRQQNKLINPLNVPYKAPEIAGIHDWINSRPLQLDALHGKVILLDFWTYSCINCIRTLPYLKNWYEKYHDKGFEIIGVHSPEFEFERDLKNVKNAVEKFGIQYPVALDNQFVTWQNYKNRYWPAHYLINQNGDVVYQHFGEGEYDVTENNIRFLLGLTEPVMVSQHSEERMIGAQTPETYLGYARAANYASPERIIENNPSHYTFPMLLQQDQWALQGGWRIERERIISTTVNAALKIHFNARQVFIVMGSLYPQSVSISVEGEQQHSVMVKDHKLYEIMDSSKPINTLLTITASAPGLEIYTFTFG